MKRETNPISNNWAVGNQVSKERKMALKLVAENNEKIKGKKVVRIKDENHPRCWRLKYV